MFSGIKWLHSKIFSIPTLGGFVAIPFFGAGANRVVMQNSDAGLGEMLAGFYQPLVTDPNRMFAVDPVNIISSDSLETGIDGAIAAAEGIVDGWGYIFEAAWQAAAPLIDISTGGAGTLVSAFSSVASNYFMEEYLSPEFLA